MRLRPRSYRSIILPGYEPRDYPKPLGFQKCEGGGEMRTLIALKVQRTKKLVRTFRSHIMQHFQRAVPSCQKDRCKTRHSGIDQHHMQVYLSHDIMVYSLSLACTDISKPIENSREEIRILPFLRNRIDLLLPLNDWSPLWRCVLLFHVSCARSC
jgi:hypothetical protein